MAWMLALSKGHSNNLAQADHFVQKLQVIILLLLHNEK